MEKSSAWVLERLPGQATIKALIQPLYPRRDGNFGERLGVIISFLTNFTIFTEFVSKIMSRGIVSDFRTKMIKVKSTICTFDTCRNE